MLGPEHPDTLNSVNNLAVLYESQGRYGEAEPSTVGRSKGASACSAPSIPRRSAASTTLRRLYKSQGRYGEAEPLYRRALEVSERVLGPDHPDTLISVNNLASLYDAQGRYREAEPLWPPRSRRKRARARPRASRSIGTRGNLAVLLVRTGRDRRGAARVARARPASRAVARHRGANHPRRRHPAPGAAARVAVHQNVAFSLALAHPSEAGVGFAADLVLRWKKRLAQEDAVLNNLARESRDPALIASIAAVRQGRAALSNVAFAEGIAPEEKLRLRRALEAAEAELKAKSAAYGRYQAVKSGARRRGARCLPRASALVEYRFFDPFDFETGQLRRDAPAGRGADPRWAPGLVDLGEAEPIIALQQGA